MLFDKNIKRKTRLKNLVLTLLKLTCGVYSLGDRMHIIGTTHTSTVL